MSATAVWHHNCACVHHDAIECARIRDARRFVEDIDPEDDEGYPRRCECACHESEDEE